MLGKIVRLQLERVRKRVEARYKIPFTYTDDVVKLVVSRCTESESGGRMIDAILTNTMLPDISREFLQRMLEGHPIERAIPAVMDRAGFGSSNYGQSLADFEREHMRILDSRTTVIILGDGRGNRTDPRVEILKRMADRAKQVVWLNPEYRTIWGTGDSDMLRYAPHCRVTAVCNTLQHLDRVISDLFRDGA
jgi:uncharacterized protein with von Willebrand factor type A (vWA) domain